MISVIGRSFLWSTSTFCAYPIFINIFLSDSLHFMKGTKFTSYGDNNTKYDAVITI